MPETRRGFVKWLSLLFGGSALGSPGAAGAGQPGGAVQPGGAGQPNDVGLERSTVRRRTRSEEIDPGDTPIRKEYELVVVGGGIAGVSTAISAARHGVRVALVHNRSMLGGNSSSEVKLYPENNSSHQPWIKESGIHDEFHTEERVRNHRPYLEGTMNCHWDLVLYEWVRREKNIDLYLNTHMHRALMQDDSRIRAVFCFQMGTEKTFELHAPLFVDASGDGYLGYRAGAEFRWGREARDEFNEPEAPLKADEKVMGNTLMFTAVDTGKPVPFKAPEWAVEFPSDDDLVARNHSHIEGGYWWTEVGAPYHPIRDNNEIVHEGLRQLLGVWDHIKNKQDHGAENYGLEFIGFWPYKRECRRMRGDHILTQHHLQNPKVQEDDVAYGCWGIDIHAQGGILNNKQIPYEPPGSERFWDRLFALPYGIPLRSLYSRNIENLMMAGRPISASYVAFASTRVLSTGSIVGQSVGIAASLCKKYGETPRVIAKKRIKECQQIILRDDGHIPGLVNEDSDDLARQATATASSQAKLHFPEPNTGSFRLDRPRAQVFPASADRIDTVDLMLYSELKSPARMKIGLRAADHVWDFRATDDIAVAEAEVPTRNKGVWVSFPLNAKVEPGRFYYVYVPDPVPEVHWKTFRHEKGEPFQLPVGVSPSDRPGKQWRRLVDGRCHIMRISPDSDCYGPQNAITGANRPDQWTNIWISDPEKQLPAWLQLQWRKPMTFNTVQLTFDTNPDLRETLPLFRYPECVKDYTIRVQTSGIWKDLLTVRDNYDRRRVHHFDAVQADRLRIDVLATNGAPTARIYEVRVYESM